MRIYDGYFRAVPLLSLFSFSVGVVSCVLFLILHNTTVKIRTSNYDTSTRKGALTSLLLANSTTKRRRRRRRRRRHRKNKKTHTKTKEKRERQKGG